MAILLKNGKKLPLLGIGTFQATEDSIVHALHKGVRHIDSATRYGNQEMVCRAVKRSGISPDKIYLTLKHNRTDFTRGVRGAVEESLKSLEMKIDVLLVHTPDEDLPMGKILEELVILQHEGKIGGVGVSNFTPSQMQWCMERHFPILINQVEFHPFFQQWEVKRYCDEKGVVLCGYRPLAGGRLVDDVRLKALAEKYHKSPAQIAWRWALQLGIPVVSKVSAEKHLNEYVDVFDFQLTEKEMEKIQLLHQVAYRKRGNSLDPASAKPGSSWG